jgi:hypothetical protein
MFFAVLSWRTIIECNTILLCSFQNSLIDLRHFVVTAGAGRTGQQFQCTNCNPAPRKDLFFSFPLIVTVTVP